MGIRIAFLTVIPVMHLAPRCGYLMALKITALPCGEIALEINQAVVNLLNALVMAPMLHASHLWTQLLPQHHLFFGVLLLRRAAVQRVSSAKNILTAAIRNAIKRENAGNSDLSFIIV